MRRTRIIVICLLFLFPAFALQGQDKKSITGNFDNYSFEHFAQEIETNYAYHFYYDIHELDSFSVNIRADHLSLHELLKKLLDKTVYHFAIDSLDRVFVTKGFIIQAALPAGIFDNERIKIDGAGKTWQIMQNHPEKIN